MLLILVKQIFKNFGIKEGNTFKIVARSRFEANDLVYESVGLMGQIGDVLLARNFLLDVSRVVTNL
jgi:hypothetical protein